jgi:hypothetical protein
MTRQATKTRWVDEQHIKDKLKEQQEIFWGDPVKIIHTEQDYWG